MPSCPRDTSLRARVSPGGPKACLRDTKLIGDDAEIYRPDRWLQATGDKLTAMENAVDLCFGIGRRVCLGRKVAYVQLNKTLVEYALQA